jgi:hypothetical protein
MFWKNQWLLIFNDKIEFFIGKKRRVNKEGVLSLNMNVFELFGHDLGCETLFYS